jgi:hypothetical protein
MGYIPIDEVPLYSLDLFERYIITYELSPDRAERLIRSIILRIRKPGRMSPFMEELAKIPWRVRG